MIKRCYGRYWWTVVPREGFPALGVLEGQNDPHVHALFFLGAADKRLKNDSVTLFKAHADPTWRDLVTGGSVWIKDVTSPSGTPVLV